MNVMCEVMWSLLWTFKMTLTECMSELLLLFALPYS